MRASIPVLLALTIGCATGAVVRDVIAPARAQGQVGPNYQYDAVVPDRGVDAQKAVLARYGLQGWRLVAATGYNYGTTFYFERQLANR